MVIPPEALAGARRALRALLREAFVVYRPTRVPDGAGGWTETLVPVATVPGHLAQLSARLAEAARALDVQASGLLAVPVETDLRAGDIVERPDGSRWRVVAPVPLPTVALVRRALVREV